jgi:cytochrome oxidase Cu insertion factor (SCO1/SenC/PrrC family)
MDFVLLAARFLLAGVFAVAGAAKLEDHAGTRRAVADFGAPDALTLPLSIAVPVVELLIAAALLPPASAAFAALAAIALLLAFLVAIVFNLARGRKPPCRCFGQIRATPIGAAAVGLNLGLLAVAAWIAWHGGGDAVPGGIAATGPSFVIDGIRAAAIVAIVALSVFAWQLRRQQHKLWERVNELEGRLDGGEGHAGSVDAEGLPIGTRAPAFALPALDGETVTLDHLLAGGKPLVLIFTDPDCESCQTLLPKLARWQREYAAALSIAVLSEGTAYENRVRQGALGLTQVLLQRKGEIGHVYGCEGTPGAVLVQPDGTIASTIAGGVDAIERLVVSLTTASAQRERIGSTTFIFGKDKST